MTVVASARPAVSSFLFCSMSLLLHLKEYRQLQSSVEKIPLYCVFGDTVIKSIVQDRPRDKQGLLAIRGLSSDKCDRYGDDILRFVRTCKKELPPPSASKRLSASGGASGNGGPVWSDHMPVMVRHTPGKKPSSSHHSGLWSRRKAVFKAFEVGAINTAANRASKAPPGKEEIYILELSQGRIYVGQSSDIRRRIQQHMAGQGSAFTKAFPPTGVVLPRLGCVSGSPEAAERDETLRYMFLRGIQAVRGWKYVRVQMSAEEERDAESNIRELFDLCRRCGHPGHFIGQCKATFDRLGRPCASN
jgi:predicted GIY-YIG superfamily endonuclease